MYLLGYDIGSSSVKACLVEAGSGKIAAQDFFPKTEMPIIAEKPGWAEQHPESWWTNLKLANESVLKQSGIAAEEIKAIGISWQMHGLVSVDKDKRVLRPAIIWCDSRAVPYGEKAFAALGEEKCLAHLLNSPGNFTAAKLAWVKENEPHIYAQIDKVMLPGDYIAMKLTGEIAVTVEGLSEGIFWDFKEGKLSDEVLDYFGFERSFVPRITPVFGVQGLVSAAAAAELGLKEGTPVCYRAGDQPNNALSLNVFHPGEIASTAGTSGVVYGVLGQVNYDPQSRVNTFAHVNHTAEQPRLGVLLCINGTGILNSWIKRNVAPAGLSYNDLNNLASQSPIGSKGLSVIPFGNGAERMLGNRETGCSFHGINFNIHNQADIIRAAQEGIVFSFRYGMEIMAEMGMDIKLIRAGNANMFLSPIFRQTLAGVSGATIELYNTDGAAGAAKGAGIGAGIYASHAEAFASLERLAVIEPEPGNREPYESAYSSWKSQLEGARCTVHGRECRRMCNCTANQSAMEQEEGNKTAKSFEDLTVWKEAMQLATSVYVEFKDNKDYGFKDQIQRSAVSIPSNIAEGYERHSNKEFIQFLYIAKGSSGELQTQLYIARKIGYIAQQTAVALIDKAKKVSSMIHNLITYRKTI
jgi:xylulokinase